MILIVFTKSYPYDFAPEYTFLHHEIIQLAKKFDQIVLVPKVCRGKRFDLPAGVEVDESFSDFIQKNSNLIRFGINVLNSNSVLQEICNHPSLLLFPAKFLRLILFSGRSEIKKNWFRIWLNEHQYAENQIVLYSYWFDDLLYGLGLIKEAHPQMLLVSRAHGYDIYEEMYFPYYWPLRTPTLSKLDKLFPASYDGRDYFRRRYPQFTDLFETAHLGVEDPGFISKSSVDGVLRIVSCAYIVPLKRIGLLLEGIACAARMRPEQKFEWLHFGEGRKRKMLLKTVKKKFPPNVKGHLPGYVPNQEILRHYWENPVDVFINLSSTEGGAPVSIMEAISCGIPVIATSVGGNPEIVSEKNGILLSSNPTPLEIAQALLNICDNPEVSYKKREESRRMWLESYHANDNFSQFAERLKALREDLQ